MAKTDNLAIIGGSGLTRLPNLEISREESVETFFGAPSSPLVFGQLHGRSLVFIARHGENHTIPPHRINYRANIQALKQCGIDCILAVAAVGGIGAELAPGKIAFPDQIIDYSYGREQTFFDENLDYVTHIDFTRPYSEDLRLGLIEASRQAGLDARETGVYACTQGPRLETAAEIERLQRDGCDMVGMTGMPEAALARELDIEYACCAVVANWAAGKTQGTITMKEIEANLQRGLVGFQKLLDKFVGLP